MNKKRIVVLFRKNLLLGKILGLYLDFKKKHRINLQKKQKIDPKLIIFESYQSSQYSCSPKAIYEYMLASPKFNDYKFIWSFKDISKYKHIENQRTSLVKHESMEYFLAFARAKHRVVNGWLSLQVIKKPGQTFLQCWHGTPFKKIRYDIPSSIETEHNKNNRVENDADVVRFTHFISPSSFASKAFKSAFNLKKLNKENIIIETGYPRNDRLINYKQNEISSIKKKLGISPDKKVLLYAPTWRDDQHSNETGYSFDPLINFEYLANQLADEYILLYRAHNLVESKHVLDNYPDFLYDVSKVDDVNDLYIISDVLVTDYSSVFFDYANLKRPIIFFMYDLEHYQNHLRGFYIDLAELPGDIVKDEKQIINILKDLSKYQNKHKTKYQLFNDKYNYLDDGKATERVVEEVFG